MVSELWFSRLGGQLWAAAVEDGRVVEIHTEWPGGNAIRAGSIHLARVRRVVPHLGAAFVALEGGEGYLQAIDLPGALETGRELVVQVRREARAGKRARVTASLEIVGPHMALRPGESGVAVSRRIVAEAERERLRRWGEEGTGRVVVRTAAAGVDDATLGRERAELAGRAARLESLAREAPAPRLLEPAPGLAERLIRDFAGRSLHRVCVEDPADAATVGIYAPDARVDRHTGPAPLIHTSGLWDEVVTALETRVQLPSGATLMIEPTEALWAIDVNAAAARGHGGSAASATGVNLEAATRIALEIRRRDIAGTIVIDFLDQTDAADREAVTNRLREALGADRRYLRISGWTGLGLCELARRRVEPGLLERLGPVAMPTAGGRAARLLADLVGQAANPRGHVATVDAATAEILRASIAGTDLEPRLKIVVDAGASAAHRLERG